MSGSKILVGEHAYIGALTCIPLLIGEGHEAWVDEQGEPAIAGRHEETSQTFAD